jgi:hypothetical protein
MKWIRIFAVSGTAFFATLAGLLSVEALSNGAVPIGLLIPGSLISAGIQGGLALCRELTSECDIEEKTKKGTIGLCLHTNRTRATFYLNHLLLW